MEDDEADQRACNGPRIVGGRHDRWSGFCGDTGVDERDSVVFPGLHLFTECQQDVGEPSPSPSVSGQVMAPSHLVSERISGGIMNQAHAAMEYVGFGGGKMMGSSSASPSVSGRVTAKSSLASRISGRIMGTARIAMGYTGFSGGGMMGR